MGEQQDGEQSLDFYEREKWTFVCWGFLLDTAEPIYSPMQIYEAESTVIRVLCASLHLVFSLEGGEHCYHLYFADEKTQAMKGRIICLQLYN